MSFFSAVKGPDVNELRCTFSNVCAMILKDDRYKSGVDPDGVATLIGDIYYYVTGNKDQRLRLPAPVCDPQDKYRVMWPEGAKVNSRAPSVASSRHSRVPSLARSYTTRDMHRASSVVSSSITTSKHRYIPMADDSDDDTEAERTTRHRKPNSRRPSVSSYEPSSPVPIRSRQNERHGNTVKINSEPLVHSQSIERIRAMGSVRDEDDEDDIPPLNSRPPASRKVYSGPTIAED